MKEYHVTFPIVELDLSKDVINRDMFEKFAQMGLAHGVEEFFRRKIGRMCFTGEINKKEMDLLQDALTNFLQFPTFIPANGPTYQGGCLSVFAALNLFIGMLAGLKVLLSASEDLVERSNMTEEQKTAYQKMVNDFYNISVSPCAGIAPDLPESPVEGEPESDSPPPTSEAPDSTPSADEKGGLDDAS